MSKLVRGAVALVLGAALLGGAFAQIPTARAAETCFDATGFCVGGVFLEYWENNGGLAINGYPLTEERVETLENGQTYTVQWFERVRMEYHPANAGPYRVLLGQFGRRIHPADPPVAPSGNGTYYEETGHNISGPFLAYWRGNGGLAQFGYPLTETFTELLEDGNEYTVQYFERARFELHPEHAGTPYEVLLGQFGRRLLAESAPTNLAPCAAGNLVVGRDADAGAGSRFATIYLTNSGTAACTLSGAPQVQPLDAAGNPLDVNAGTEGTAPVGIVVLPPSEMASFGLRWSNWCGADPGAAQARVTLPNNGGQFTTSAPSTPPCLGESQPSTFGITPFTVEGPVAHANIVLRFYKAINAGDYAAAYDLFGATLQGQQDYEAFAAGYANTQRVDAIITSIGVSAQPDIFSVGVELAATQTDGSVRQFSGLYAVGPENGALLIVAADIAAE